MKCIAKASGVSQPTVSLILNNKSSKVKISEATRLRVLDAAKKLGYYRNEQARAMRTGSSKVIAVTGDFMDYAMRIFNGMAKSAYSNGYSMKIIPNHDEISIEEIVRIACENRVAGMLCASMPQKDIIFLSESLQKFDIPLILFDSGFKLDNSPVSSVHCNEHQGGRLIAEHLEQLGHTNIAYISSSAVHTYCVNRFNGIKDYFATNKKIKLYTCITDKEIQFTPAAIQRLDRLFDEHPEITAVACASDHPAIKMIRYFHERNLKVPQDISVTGFGDMMASQVMVPALTTISQPFELLGKKSFDMMVKTIETKKMVENVTLDVELKIRESTQRIAK